MPASSEVFLVNVQNKEEAHIVQALLEAHEIISLLKFSGAGAYTSIYMGSSNFGVDIYVLQSQLEQAKEVLINHMEGFAAPKKNGSLSAPDKDPYKKKRRTLGWILVTVFIIIPGLIALLFNTYLQEF